jgi:hypothetical protein
MCNIQNVPRGMVNILESHGIGHIKQKVYLYMCHKPNRFGERAISLYSSRIVDEKKKYSCLRTVSNTDIYCSGETLVQFT